MSPHVGNFVADLVEMAKATETLPLVQRQLDEANTKITSLQDTIQSRELHIIDLKGALDDIQAKLNAAEAARDEAELRFLDADERAGKALDRLSEIMGLADAIQGKVRDTREVIEGPKLEPELKATLTEEEVIALTSPGSVLPISSSPPPSGPSTHGGSSGTEAVGPGQSEADPTPASVNYSSERHAPNVTIGSVENVTSVSLLSLDSWAGPSSDATRYKGRSLSSVLRDLNWDEFPPTLEQWIAGGGDDAGWNS